MISRNVGSVMGMAKVLTYSGSKIVPSVGYSTAIPTRKIRNPHDMKFLPSKDVNDYMAFLPKFIDDVTSKDILLGYPPVNRRFRSVLEYMCPQGKHLRQHLMIFTYKTIEQHHNTLTQEKMEDIHKLCWCLELFNTGNTIMDDIADDHDYRRKMKTWHKIAGRAAVSDMVLIYFSLFGILRKYFSQHPRFKEIFDIFLGTTTAVSLCLEFESSNFEDFTMERCKDIALIKTAYYVGDQPFLLATLLANKELQMYDQVKQVFQYLGILYSVLNDVHDVYGNDITGKPSRDIQDNVCSFLIAMAREKASDSQMKILKENYGRRNKACVDKVIEIYKDLDILGEYYKLEKEYLEKTSEKIRNIPDEFTRSLIEKLAYVQSFGVIGVPPY